MATLVRAALTLVFWMLPRRTDSDENQSGVGHRPALRMTLTVGQVPDLPSPAPAGVFESVYAPSVSTNAPRSVGRAHQDLTTSI